MYPPIFVRPAAPESKGAFNVNVNESLHTTAQNLKALYGLRSSIPAIVLELRKSMKNGTVSELDKLGVAKALQAQEETGKSQIQSRGPSAGGGTVFRQADDLPRKPQLTGYSMYRPLAMGGIS